jgi:maleate isomerase
MTRIGVLVPSTNTTVESDFQRSVPEGISIHSQRLRIPLGEMTEGFLDQMNRDLDNNIMTLGDARVKTMAYCCTSGSFYRGPGWDQAVVEKIARLSGSLAIATSMAVVDALRDANARKLSVATPYPDWTNEKLRVYFESLGFEILNIAGDTRARQGGHTFVNDQDPEEIADFVIKMHDAQADTVFCSCTAWRSMEAIPTIELKTGKKVITSNQATIWATLRALGYFS